MLKKER